MYIASEYEMFVEMCLLYTKETFILHSILCLAVIYVFLNITVCLK